MLAKQHNFPNITSPGRLMNNTSFQFGKGQEQYTNVNEYSSRNNHLDRINQQSMTLEIVNVEKPTLKKSNSKDSLMKNVVDSLSFIMGRGSQQESREESKNNEYDDATL